VLREASGDRAFERTEFLNKRTSWNAMKNMFLQARTIRVAILLYPPLTAAHVCIFAIEKRGNNHAPRGDDSPRISQLIRRIARHAKLPRKGEITVCEIQRRFPHSLPSFENRTEPNRTASHFVESSEEGKTFLCVERSAQAVFVSGVTPRHNCIVPFVCIRVCTL